MDSTHCPKIHAYSLQVTRIVLDERGTAVTLIGGDGADEREHIVEVMES